MFEDVDKLRAREAEFLSDAVFESTKVRTVAEIRKLLRDLQESTDDRGEVTAELRHVNDEGELQVLQAKAEVVHKSKHSVLKECLAALKARIDYRQQAAPPIVISGRAMVPAPVACSTDYSWADSLISRWLGAFRRDAMICWDIGDGFEYQYDITTESFGRVAKGP